MIIGHGVLILLSVTEKLHLSSSALVAPLHSSRLVILTFTITNGSCKRCSGAAYTNENTVCEEQAWDRTLPLRHPPNIALRLAIHLKNYRFLRWRRNDGKRCGGFCQFII